MSLFVHACMGDAAQMQVRDAMWSRVTTRVSRILTVLQQATTDFPKRLS